MIKIITTVFLLLELISATEIKKWKGETLQLDVSVKNTSHFVFDEKIARDIYPTEENVNIIRNGKDVYFRYNPFTKYKIIKNGNDVKKIKEGVTYKGNPIKVWFIGEESGTNYALYLNPVETEEDTFYIQNKSIEIESTISKSKEEPRTLKITKLAKSAARDEPISGFTQNRYSRIVKSTHNYSVRHIKGYHGLLYDVNVYRVHAKRDTYLDEFKFINLPKSNKVFIGLLGGWKNKLFRGENTKVIIVSEK